MELNGIELNLIELMRETEADGKKKSCELKIRVS